MNTLMTTLQQPLSVAALAQCLGFGSRPAPRAVKRRSRGPHDSFRRALAATAEALNAQGLDEHTAPGCGWYDSSHELHQGLVVLEHSAAEGLGAELPVTVWLKLALHDASAAGLAGDGAWPSLRA